MNRDSLDEFFANAEDILTDWHGGIDAMRGEAPGGTDTELLELADCYYDQRSHYEQRPSFTLTQIAPQPLPTVAEMAQAMARANAALSVSLRRFAQAIERTAKAIREAGLHPAEPPTDARSRALYLRQHRNTGPANRHRLDGSRAR